MATIWRLPQALAAAGKTRTPWYSDISQGLMTRPVKLSQRATGWPADEVEAVIRARIAGWSNEAIRSLVTRLHARRLELSRPPANGLCIEEKEAA